MNSDDNIVVARGRRGEVAEEIGGQIYGDRKIFDFVW